MPQSCTVCIHPQLQAVNAELIANRSSLRAIGARYCLSKSALGRHFNSHLVPVQDALPQPIGEPQQVSEPGQVAEAEICIDRRD